MDVHVIQRRTWAAADYIPVCLLLGLFTVVSLSTLALFGFSESPRSAGEADAAYLGAVNLATYGWQWAGLQDMATSENPRDHPLLYIHHPNFGLYVSYAMLKFGIASLEWQNALSLIGALIGLAFAYLFGARLLRSPLAGVVLCALLAFNVDFILNWSFNVHRSFTYFSVFGSMYAFLRWSEARNAKWGIVFFMLCVTLVGTDYMFYFWTMFALLAYITLLETEKRMASVTFVIATFAAIFLLRQAQVAIGLGPHIWFADFWFQVLNRLNMSYLYPVDWAHLTAEFYEKHRVMNPGFTSTMTLIERAYTLVVGTGEAVLRSVGIIEPHKRLSLGVGIIFGVVMSAWFGTHAFKARELGRAQKIALMFFIPSIAMSLIFPNYFPNWYRAFLLGHICIAVWTMCLVSSMLPRRT